MEKQLVLFENNNVYKQYLQEEIHFKEMQYAIKHEIYHGLIEGNQTVEGFANVKTRNRMRTRVTQNRKIGLPVKGRAKKIPRKKRKRRRRVGENGKTLSWKRFLKENSSLSFAEKKQKWKKYPRISKTVQLRRYKNEEMTWNDCMHRFGHLYDSGDLHRWYLNLQRIDYRRKLRMFVYFYQTIILKQKYFDCHTYSYFRNLKTI